MLRKKIKKIKNLEEKINLINQELLEKTNSINENSLLKIKLKN